MTLSLRAIGMAVLGILVTLVAIPSLSWVVRVVMRNTVNDDAVVATHDAMALVAVAALILVSLVRVIAVIERTTRWTPLSRSIVAWDGMIATYFLWSVADDYISWFRGPWERPVSQLALAVVGLWGVVAIIRATPRLLDSILPGKVIIANGPQVSEVVQLAEATKAAAAETERLAKAAKEAAADAAVTGGGA